MKELKDPIKIFLHEFKKDLFFIPPIGTLVGGLLLAQFEFKKIGISKESSWTDALFESFISHEVFVFFALIFLVSSCIKSYLNSKGKTWNWLNKFVSHFEIRLMQLSSTIILFSIGLSIFALLTEFFTNYVGGIKFCKSLSALNVVILLCSIGVSYILHLIHFAKNSFLSGSLSLGFLCLLAYYSIVL